LRPSTRRTRKDLSFPQSYDSDLDERYSCGIYERAAPDFGEARSIITNNGSQHGHGGLERESLPGTVECGERSVFGSVKHCLRYHQSSSSSTLMVSRGAFVVIEGLDRAGKTTQVATLQARLETEGVPVKLFKFPGTTIVELTPSILNKCRPHHGHRKDDRCLLALSIRARQPRDPSSFLCEPLGTRVRRASLRLSSSTTLFQCHN
jgi:hypothetical protein